MNGHRQTSGDPIVGLAVGLRDLSGKSTSTLLERV